MATHLAFEGLASAGPTPEGLVFFDCQSTLPDWLIDLSRDDAIRLASHVRDGSGNLVLHDGPRSAPLRPVPTPQQVNVPIVLPHETGRYQIELDFVVENRFWGTDLGLSAEVVPVERTSEGWLQPAAAPGAAAADTGASTGNAGAGRADLAALNDWIADEGQWPTGDTHDPETFAPGRLLAVRERELREHMPDWFWTGEPGEAILSLGAGKLYFERRYWRAFEQVAVVDPAERTRLAVQRDRRFPNLCYLARDLFSVPSRLPLTPKYGWIGAASHYVFAEQCGWEFLARLAMLISDTLVIDGGVFDGDTPTGQRLLDRWTREILGSDVLDRRRELAFSYRAFRQALGRLWRVEHEWRTGWVGGDRRGVVLRRDLPPVVQLRALGELRLVADRRGRDHNAWRVFRCQLGYFKELADVGPMLEHDVIGKLMGWPAFVLARVYDADRYCGFVTPDFGEDVPAEPREREALFARIAQRMLPLGLLPVDMSRYNLRRCNDELVWIDVDLRGLAELSTTTAVWAFQSPFD